MAGDFASPDPSASRLAFTTRRPVAVTMVVLAVAVFGFVSLGKLPLDLLPELSYPTITVRTEYPGAAPLDVEERLSVRIQEELSTLARLVRVTSVSRAEVSDVLLEFGWKTPMTFAVQDVRERLDGVELPPGAGRPILLRYDPNLDPILRIALSGLEDRMALRELAEEEVKREIEGLEGVAAVRVRGGLEEEIRVALDPDALASFGIPTEAVISRLAEENVNAAGGDIEEGGTEYIVRTLNEFRTIDDISQVVVLRREGVPIRVQDLGRVLRTHRERQVVTRVDGEEAVEIDVYREAGANIVRLAERVRDRLFGTAQQRSWVGRSAAASSEEAKEGVDPKERERRRREARLEEERMTDFLSHHLPPGARLTLLSDASRFIEDSLRDVRDTAVAGGLLAILVLYAFLRRLLGTVVLAVSIPLSVVATFAPMFLSDVSLNVMSLGGLALGIGMLVDNSIVVLESISRCREEGDDVVRAAIRGVSEVGGAVTASTLTTVAVFFPIVFVEGIAGQIFRDQALTVVSALLVSLGVSLTFIPMLTSRRLRREATTAAPSGAEAPAPRWRIARAIPRALRATGRGLLAATMFVFAFLVGRIVVGGLLRLLGLILRPLLALFDPAYRALERLYPRVLLAALRHPIVVLLAVLALSTAAFLRLPHLGSELLPEVHQAEFTAEIGLGVGTPLARTDAILTPVAQEVRGDPEVEAVVLVSGVDPTELTSAEEGEHTAKLTVRLRSGPHLSRRESAVLDAVRNRLAAFPEVERLRFRRPTVFTFAAPIEVEIRGPEIPVLTRLGREVVGALERLPGLSDVRSSVRRGNPEIRVAFDREKLLAYGLDLRESSTLLRDHVLGRVATTFPRREERIDIRVQAEEEARRGIERLRGMVVNPGSDAAIPLSAVASLEVVEGPAEVRRIGNRRAVVVTASSRGLDLGGLSRRIELELAGIDRPPGYAVELGGQKREMAASLGSMRFALALAVFLVYLVMAAQFESVLQPLVILLTVPLALVTVVLALDGFDIPLSVVVFLGMILLAGIVVNNAIVLLDRANSRRRAGMPVQEAILDAARARLRPILMTTATTVLGLLPMTGWLGGVPLLGGLGGGEGAELRTPMAITVVAGLTGATVLTLVVIPVVYRLLVRERRSFPPEDGP